MSRFADSGSYQPMSSAIVAALPTGLAILCFLLQGGLNIGVQMCLKQQCPSHTRNILIAAASPMSGLAGAFTILAVAAWAKKSATPDMAGGTLQTFGTSVSEADQITCSPSSESDRDRCACLHWNWRLLLHPRCDPRLGRPGVLPQRHLLISSAIFDQECRLRDADARLGRPPRRPPPLVYFHLRQLCASHEKPGGSERQGVANV